jgi:hypothetical protein
VGYGAQVYQNMQNGQSFTAALTTDIDAGKIVAGAVVGAVVGGTLGAAAPALTTYGTVAVAQVQTTAVAAAAAHPTAAAAVGGLVETAVECAMTGGGCGKADYAVGAVTAGVAHRLSTPPNPNGRNGGENHQMMVDGIAGELADRGMLVVREFYVPTSGGNKNSRFVDIAGLDPKTMQPIELHQVGRQTRGGLPVARERYAIDDIQNTIGINADFHPYN